MKRIFEALHSANQSNVVEVLGGPSSPNGTIASVNEIVAASAKSLVHASHNAVERRKLKRAFMKLAVRVRATETGESETSRKF